MQLNGNSENIYIQHKLEKKLRPSFCLQPDKKSYGYGRVYQVS